MRRNLFPTEVNAYGKYLSRKDRALVTIVLSVDPSLLYIIGDPVDLTVVWKKVSGQVSEEELCKQVNVKKETVFTKVDLLRSYIKTMTEIFEELCVIGDIIEDRLIYNLASLPDSFCKWFGFWCQKKLNFSKSCADKKKTPSPFISKICWDKIQQTAQSSTQWCMWKIEEKSLSGCE